ncbi:MAG: CoA activase [Deltaproteobacteria bacterium]|nr:CoA activase [Deltaproteobacteria bacterium]MBW2128602.1 CoA activase [Deltaproteobacteria bacterium]MBW2304494.1 CoA activase [Deltaproteobacteria bacterium]
MISAGIDCGAKNTKTVIMQDARIIGRGMVSTGFDQAEAINASIEAACKDAGITRDQIEKWAGTGSGKSVVENALIVNDIKAMAKGGRYFFPNARTVADVGAEEGRAVKVRENGNIEDFTINEKCAAGAGAFVEAMARALEVTIEEMGALCLQSNATIPMNAQCAIFAESEVVGLIHAKTPKPDISRAIHDAIAARIVSMIRRIGVNEDVVLMGGMGRNPGFKDAMLRELEIEKIYIPEEPEYGMAVGAAVVAMEKGR